MQVSFGKLIQTKVYVDGKHVVGDEASEITNLVCKVLRKDKGGAGNTIRGEEQRCLFEENVPDYKCIKKEGVFYNKDSTPQANVTSVNIKGFGTGRFLATGKDIQKVANVGNDYNYNVTRGRELIYDPDENYYYSSHPEEAAQAYKKTVNDARGRHVADLKGIFWNNGLGKLLEIRVRNTTLSKPEKANGDYEQLSLFSPISIENAPTQNGKTVQSLPLYKRYEIESLSFKPETLVYYA